MIMQNAIKRLGLEQYRMILAGSKKDCNKLMGRHCMLTVAQ